MNTGIMDTSIIDGWEVGHGHGHTGPGHLHGSHGLSAPMAWKTMSRRNGGPEGPF